tara:strand:- start:593 stop:2476 length:1884 start_codon:yes stop_codon:yes gene_type:complete
MASAEAQQPRARLHIGGLPRELLDDELRARFTPFGVVFGVEVLREKPNSPFFRREGDGASSDESESEDVPTRGRGGRGGRGGKGGRGGGVNAKPSTSTANTRNHRKEPPHPCRGFAYVDLLATDAKSLNRCVTLYNGCKWKGGTLSVTTAKPGFAERLIMEREGVDALGVSLKGTKAAAGAKDAKENKSSNDDETRDEVLLPLKPGDALEIDGRVRYEKVTVLVGKGAKQHLSGGASFPAAVTHINTNSDWREFDEKDSWRSKRRVYQLPEIELRVKELAAQNEKRFEQRRTRMLARLGRDGKTLEVVAGSSPGGESPSVSKDSDDENGEDSEYSDDEYSKDSDDDDDAQKPNKSDRFALPREFFASAIAAERAADNTDSSRVQGSNSDQKLKSALSAREKFGLGPALRVDANSVGSARGKDSMEMRALAAFMGGDDSGSDDDEGEEKPSPPAVSEPRAVKLATAKAAAATSKPAPRDPTEGGVPMAAGQAKWWEKGDETKNKNDEKRSTADAPDAKRVKNNAVTATPPVPTAATRALASDFFRADDTALFVPFGQRNGNRDANSDDDGDDSSRSVESDSGGTGEGAEGASDSEGDVGAELSEDKLLEDWQGEGGSDSESSEYANSE